MKIRRRVHHQSMIPTASMADIAMLLLIFFMSTTIIRSREATGVRLPGAFTGEPIRRETSIRISLSGLGEVAMNDAHVSMDQVAPLVAETLRENPALLISLYADSRTPYATVALLIEQLERARAPRVALAASRIEMP